MNTTLSTDGKHRCQWCAQTDDFIPYHDREWGFPVADDQRLFEKLTLESFQSGLSWRTILAKRDNFRAAFARFDFYRVARFTEKDKHRLLNDAGIVRHQGKIAATINNAQRACELVQQEGSLAAYFWRYDTHGLAVADAASAQAKRLSKDLKQRGWQFTGPTTVYAFMQAAGLVNDHAPDCWSHAKVVQQRAKFTAPTPSPSHN